MTLVKLYLMRHGDALPVGGEVHEDLHRPLSPAGSEQVRRVAEGWKRREQAPDVVISSPLMRAMETAEIMADVLGVPRVQTSPALAPNMSPVGLRALVSSQKDARRLLLVGHHPDVTLWTAFLASLDPSVCPLFGTASVAALQLDPAKKKADFLWFQTWEQLSEQ